MRGVTFHSFPHKVRAKRLRKVWINMVRRENTWAPNRHTYICSRHFEGGQGPTDEHPIPTIFPWNTPATSRPTSALCKLEQGRLEIRNTANVSMGRSLLTNVALYRGVVGEVVVSTGQMKEAKGAGKHNVLLPQGMCICLNSLRFFLRNQFDMLEVKLSNLLIVSFKFIHL